MFSWVGSLIGKWKKCDSVTRENYCQNCKRCCGCATIEYDIEQGPCEASTKEIHPWGC